jgi:transcriptional regulator with GAF, ATPase, and Fis domain
LRHRKQDLPLLVQHFVRRYAEKYGKSIAAIPAHAMNALEAHDWPGNVRESARGWRVSGKGGAAELLGLRPSTLDFRMKKRGINRPA